jgi:hypothetical protein
MIRRPFSQINNYMIGNSEYRWFKLYIGLPLEGTKIRMQVILLENEGASSYRSSYLLIKYSLALF